MYSISLLLHFIEWLFFLIYSLKYGNSTKNRINHRNLYVYLKDLFSLTITGSLCYFLVTQSLFYNFLLHFIYYLFNEGPTNFRKLFAARASLWTFRGFRLFLGHQKSQTSLPAPILAEDSKSKTIVKKAGVELLVRVSREKTKLHPKLQHAEGGVPLGGAHGRWKGRTQLLDSAKHRWEDE